jgi:hypothetical protein
MNCRVCYYSHRRIPLTFDLFFARNGKVLSCQFIDPLSLMTFEIGCSHDFYSCRQALGSSFKSCNKIPSSAQYMLMQRRFLGLVIHQTWSQLNYTSTVSPERTLFEYGSNLRTLRIQRKSKNVRTRVFPLEKLTSVCGVPALVRDSEVEVQRWFDIWVDGDERIKNNFDWNQDPGSDLESF